jgi:CheY-like chemotaxis protein
MRRAFLFPSRVFDVILLGLHPQPQKGGILSGKGRVREFLHTCRKPSLCLGRTGVLRVSLTSHVATEESVLSHPDMRPGTYVEFMVSDTGVGMDDATLKRIFEPFYSTKPADEGTGLGLSVVHGIVKEHEGAIYVYSRQGEGAVFKIFFPSLPLLRDASDPAAPALFQGEGQRVLFVEDEPILGKVAEMMLRRLGCHASIQSNPVAALDLFKSSPADFDLVITDLTMPGMTGIDLACGILSIRPDIPILLTSGFGGAWTPEKLQAIGIRQLVMKPVSMVALSGALQSVFPDQPGKDLKMLS